MSYERKNEGSRPEASIAAEMARIGTEVKSAIEKQSAEIKANGETSAKTAARIEELGNSYATLEGELSSLKQSVTEAEAKAARLPQGAEERKSLGAQFIESAEFKGIGDRNGPVQTRFNTKAALTTGNSGAVIDPQTLPYRALPTEPHIRNLFSQGQTTSDTLRFPQLQAFTNAAAQVPDDGVTQKPESTLKMKVVAFPVATIAHLMRVHRNLLQDAPALRSIIDTQMVEGLRYAEDLAFIKGDGADETVKGILAQSKTFTRAKVNDTRLDTLRRAVTDLRLSNYTADGFLLNPLDLEEIELLKGSDSRYILNTVTDANGVTRVWRVPVIDSAAIDEGQFVAGNFQRGGQVFDREEAVIEVFEQDRDNVALNLVTIRAEERVALVVYDVNAFIKGVFA